MRRGLALIALLALAGCTSPEATRQRAGGPGADVGNRNGVELHAGADPFAKTPTVKPQAPNSEVAASPSSR
jgi:hypothetical protein